MQLLCQLAEVANVAQQARSMLSGEKINVSEDRAVLHTALRLPAQSPPILVDGENVLIKIHQELEKALNFAERIINGLTVPQ